MTLPPFVRFTAGGLFLLLLLAGKTIAAESCDVVVGQLATVEGRVEVQRSGASSWQAGNLGAELCQGDTVRAAERSRATVALINQAVLRIDQNTAMRLDNISGVTEERSVVSLLKGAFQSFSRKPRGFEVNTPYLNGSIEGTEFVFRVGEDESVLTVFEGTVLASNAQGSASVSGGESVAAKAGQAPQPRTVVRPRDAAQWSLYYPPILAAGDAGASAAMRQAAADLSVGRVDAARSGVEQTIAAGGADAGLAYALRAVINVVQNQPAQALADGNQAVSLSPDSAAAKIALSYAQQANFQIAEARDTLQQAVDQQPGDALAHARLAELQLMLGNRAQASASAQQAVALAPDLGRTQITLGFAALAEFRNDAATAAFERAIELDSADPLPHLGLGLAKISAGDLEAGRKDIEVAVGLGSNDALLRAYLGKAYFEEKRAPLDSDQFDIARQLDPNDPTAYLYSGIAKQTQNRPVEAARDLEQSVELNDNRAAYRGRLLLDKDRAARGTSVARAYNDLGFKQLGILESSKSLSTDPSNASAHRFMSDTYFGTRRTEIARVSETLQAQLLQDININPVQPSLAATNLNIVTLGGAAQPGFNEFTPLFQRNKAQLNASMLGGSNSTTGGEAVVSGVFDRFSFSAGAMSYDTDGWRRNNEIDQELYNVFAQWAITDELNVQVEYQDTDSEEGDLAFNFDPDNFSRNKTIDRDKTATRVGLRYSPSERSTFLFSYIHNDSEEGIALSEEFFDCEPYPSCYDDPDAVFMPAIFSVDNTFDDDGDQYEAQYIHLSDKFNLVAGASYSDNDREITDDVTFAWADDPTNPYDSFMGTEDQEVEHPRGYLYANVPTMGDAVVWTVGLSYDDYEQGMLEETNYNPKFGVQWSVRDDIQMRAAAFKMVKPLLVNNRTLEPTQVAGFNQFFDDINGTESTRYGLGLDWRVQKNLSLGVELTTRDLDEPVFLLFEDPPRVDFEDRDEDLHRLYAYWTPSDQWGVKAEVVYDKYTSETGEATEFGDLPYEVKTVSVPVAATYFHPSGFFGGLQGTYVDQEVDRSEFAVAASGEDDFFVVDLSLGYRLPKRYGIASLGVKNLFDEEFSYQDNSFREFSSTASTGPYFPERIIMGQITLSF